MIPNPTTLTIKHRIIAASLHFVHLFALAFSRQISQDVSQASQILVVSLTKAVGQLATH